MLRPSFCILSVIALLVACGPAGCHDEQKPLHAAICSRDVRASCRTVESLEALLVDPRMKILASEKAAGGSHDARLLTVEVPAKNEADEAFRFRVKWRTMSSQTGVNDPRREVATYAFQNLFLDPQDFVFPPTRTRCFELHHYREMVDAEAQSDFSDKNACVLGAVSLWLTEGKPLTDRPWYREQVFDLEKWQEDAAYRRTLADANLLTYLTSNGDTHTGQWIFTGTPNGKRVHLVDASIAFDYEQNTALPPERDFGRIIVPALRKKSLDRVMGLTRRELWSLTAIERLVPRGDTLHSERASRSQVQRPPKDGMEWQPCPDSVDCDEQLVIALTEPELGLVTQELWHLRNRVDVGEISTW